MVSALRRAGVPVSLQGSQRLAAALRASKPIARTDLYWVARISLVNDVRHIEAFDQLFDVVFEGGALPTGRDARKSNQPSPPTPGDEHHKLFGKATSPTAVGGVPWTTNPSVADDEHQIDSDSELELPELLPASLAAIADQPFDELLDADLLRIGRWLEEALVAWPTRRARRNRPAKHGPVDLRRTLVAARRTGGDPLRLSRRAPVRRPRRVVMLADVSGSMQSFVRPYLHVMRALASSADAEVYAFATRLTRITNALAHSDPSEAIARASEIVDDRFSGTRIATSLGELQKHPTWSNSVRGAVVLVASDGWDTDPADELQARMARLARLSHKIVWVNPRAAADSYEPLVGGMKAALPHCDRMLSGHSLQAMRDVLLALADQGRQK